MAEDKRRKSTPLGVLLASGLEEAFLGIGRRCGQEDVAVYSIQKAERLLADKLLGVDGTQQKVTEEEYFEALVAARSYLEANSIGCWVGEMTPMWVEGMTMDEFKELVPGIEVYPENMQELENYIGEILDADCRSKTVQVH